jgi:excisionase family DNA binding protein
MSELHDELIKHFKDANSFPLDGPVTTKEVASYFRVSAETVRTWIKKKKGFPSPVVLNDRSCRFDAAEIRTYWNTLVANNP